MSETIEVVEQPEYMKLIKYNVSDAAIAKIQEHLDLRVCDFNDGEGYALCKEARKETRRLRLEIEAKRKELKRDVIDFGKAIDSEARRVTEPIAEVEEHLKTQIAIIDDEKARRAEEQKRLAIERVERMKRLLAEVEAPYNVIEECNKYDDETFEEVLGFHEMEYSRKKAEEKRQAEHLRQLEEQAAKAKAEAEEKERIEREKQAAIEAENRKLREQIEAQRQKELEAERARVEAAEEARRKAEAEKQAAIEQAKREKREAEEKRLREEQERLAAEAQKKAEKEERIAKEQAAARKKAKDKALFDKVAAKFTTLPECHTEIVRLINLLEKQKLA